MRLPRIYHAEHELKVGGRVRLSEGARKHIATVLRLRPGEQLVLFDSKSRGEFRATLQSDRVTVQLDAFAEEARVESNTKTHLLLPLCRLSSKSEWVIEKAVELGVSRIVPVATDRSEAAANRVEKRAARWRALITAAAEQSGRVQLPELAEDIVPLSEALRLRDPLSLCLMFHPLPHGAESLRAVHDSNRAPAFIQICTGPEKGFSEAELQLARATGARVCSLGPRILRAETASVAALALVQAFWGDLLQSKME